LSCSTGGRLRPALVPTWGDGQREGSAGPSCLFGRGRRVPWTSAEGLGCYPDFNRSAGRGLAVLKYPSDHWEPHDRTENGKRPKGPSRPTIGVCVEPKHGPGTRADGDARIDHDHQISRHTGSHALVLLLNIACGLSVTLSDRPRRRRNRCSPVRRRHVTTRMMPRLTSSNRMSWARGLSTRSE